MLITISTDDLLHFGLDEDDFCFQPLSDRRSYTRPAIYKKRKKSKNLIRDRGKKFDYETEQLNIQYSMFMIPKMLVLLNIKL
jgi:hypothetical protein